MIISYVYTYINMHKIAFDRPYWTIPMKNNIILCIYISTYVYVCIQICIYVYICMHMFMYINFTVPIPHCQIHHITLENTKRYTKNNENND
jgi:hypothetical protein